MDERVSSEAEDPPTEPNSSNSCAKPKYRRRPVYPKHGFNNPRKPDWTIKRGNVHVDVWADLDKSPPFFRTKLSVMRVNRGTDVPWERVQACISFVDELPEEDELTLAAMLMKEAQEWVEREREKINMRRGSNRVRNFRLSQKRKARIEAPKFEPIGHDE